MSRRHDALRLGLSSLPASGAQRVLLFRLVLATAHELRTRMDRLLAESGLTTQQAMVLQFLHGEPEPPTLTRFARLLGMSHQNLKQIASALERKGLVDIVVDPHDARSRRLQLTKAHARLWNRRDPGDFAEVAGWTAVLNDNEVSTAVALLDAMHETLIESRAGAKDATTAP